MNRLTHLDSEGRTRMVAKGDKCVTTRQVEARGKLLFAAETLVAVQAGTTPLGNVIATAELAGVMAAKRTSERIQFCHPLPLTKALVEIAIDDGLSVGLHHPHRGADQWVDWRRDGALDRCFRR